MILIIGGSLPEVFAECETSTVLMKIILFCCPVQ